MPGPHKHLKVRALFYRTPPYRILYSVTLACPPRNFSEPCSVSWYFLFSATQIFILSDSWPVYCPISSLQTSQLVLTDVIAGPCPDWLHCWSLYWLMSLLVPVLTDVITGPYPSWRHGWFLFWLTSFLVPFLTDTMAGPCLNRRHCWSLY